MTHKVLFTHSNKSCANIGRAKVREGKEVYRHPEGRYIVLEFQGRSGKFRESFWPEDIIKDKFFLRRWRGQNGEKEVSNMQIPEQLMEKFCNEVCSYSHLKILEPKVWKHLDPCLNCCVDHFVDWLEKVPEKGCK